MILQKGKKIAWNISKGLKFFEIQNVSWMTLYFLTLVTQPFLEFEGEPDEFSTFDVWKNIDVIWI